LEHRPPAEALLVGRLGELDAAGAELLVRLRQVVAVKKMFEVGSISGAVGSSPCLRVSMRFVFLSGVLTSSQRSSPYCTSCATSNVIASVQKRSARS
jgi:hypothetical protein